MTRKRMSAGVPHDVGELSDTRLIAELALADGLDDLPDGAFLAAIEERGLPPERLAALHEERKRRRQMTCKVKDRAGNEQPNLLTGECCFMMRKPEHDRTADHPRGPRCVLCGETGGRKR